MSERTVFYPPMLAGRIYHIIAIIVLSVAGLWGLWNTTRAQEGTVFLLQLTPMVLAVTLVPFLSYRLYTLYSAHYTLEREHLHLRWGWRLETIPMNNIEWILPVSDLETPLRLPWLRWPGAILGYRHLPDGRLVEFLATQKQKMMLIGTPERIFAISPNDPNAFLLAHQRLIELGSLNPSTSRSVHPSFLFARVWKSLIARYLLIIGAILSLALLIWTRLAVDQISHISLGYTPDGIPNEPLPAIQLLLLPILSISAYLINSILGFVFYRRDDQQSWAYLLWGNSILMAAIFFIAIYRMLYGA